MRILFLTQVLPFPLDAGPKIRSYYVLRHLMESGQKVTLLSFVRDSDSLEALAHLRSFCGEVLTVRIQRSRISDAKELIKSLVTREPFLISRDWVQQMATTVEKTARRIQPDAIHADQLWMAPYAQLAARSLGTADQPRMVLDQHNAVFQIPQRLAAAEKNPVKRALANLEAQKMARYEAKTCQLFDEVVWVTREDQAAFHGLSPELRTAVADRVIPISLEPGPNPSIRRKKDARRVTFLGGLHWPPNSQGILWFLNEVWPHVQSQAPNSVLTIIGKDPPKDLLRRARRSKRVEVTGYMDDPSRLLEETAAFIIPLLSGGGMRVKLLDAWRWGLPTVTTRIGAEGIEIENEENVLIGDTPGEFSRALLCLLTQPGLAQRLVQGGFQTVQTGYNWQRAYSAWNDIYPCEYCSSLHTRPA